MAADGAVENRRRGRRTDGRTDHHRGRGNDVRDLRRRDQLAAQRLLRGDRVALDGERIQQRVQNGRIVQKSSPHDQLCAQHVAPLAFVALHAQIHRRLRSQNSYDVSHHFADATHRVLDILGTGVALPDRLGLGYTVAILVDVHATH